MCLEDVKKDSRVKDRLAKIQAKNQSESNMILTKKIQDDLDKWHERLELVWKQKFRELWIIQGDKNTMFFHTTIIVNKK